MKENDWIVTKLNNPDFTPAQLDAAGVTPENTGLLTADQYKKSPVIQEAFKNKETGKFDEAQFNTFYNRQAKDYNIFATKQYQDTLESDYKYARTDTSRPSGSQIRDIKLEVDRISNPDRLTTGLEAVNVEGARTQSASEIAQSRSIFNTDKGKFEDETPNDSSLITSATKWIKSVFNPLVMAQWDQDGTHVDPISGRTVNHKKGEYKVDNDGTYYYETLGNKSAYGKQIKSIWDTITVDNTPWNKYDFMDSDGLDKSVTGSVVKAAAQIAPMFIPVVGDYYIAGLIADEMADFVPTLTKTISRSIGQDTPEFLDKIQAISRSSSSNTSEYAQQHVFAIENFTNLIKDVALQLPEQQMIFKSYTKANKLFTDLGVAKDFKSITDDAVKIAKDLPEYKNLPESAIKDLVDQTSLTEIAKSITTQQRKAANISLAYMAIISGADTYEQAKQAGFDDKAAALMTWGTIGGIYAVDRTGIGEWMFPELTPDVRMFRNTERNLSKNLVDTFAKNKSVEEQGTNGWYRGLWDGMSKGTKNYWEKVKTHSMSVSEKMFTEGLEEVSEEVASDAVKTIANTISDLGLTTNNPHIEIQDVGPRYLMNFLGGAIGGGIYTARDIAFGSKYENKDVTKDIIYLARNNKLNDFLEEIEKSRKKGMFGNKYLGVNPTFDNNGNAFFTTPDKDNKSQNDYIADAIVNQVKVIQSILNDDPNNNVSDHSLIDKNFRALTSSDKIQKVREELGQQANRIVKIEALSNLPDSAIYTGGLLSDYQKSIEDIVDIKRRLATYRSKTDTELSREKKEGVQNIELDKLKDELIEAESKRDSLVSGSKAEQYVGMATFVMNPFLSKSYINATFSQYAVANEHIPYEKISKERLKDLWTKYTEYKKTKQNEDIKNAYNLFTEFNKVYSPQITNIASQNEEYWKERNEFYNQLVDIDKSLEQLQQKNGKVEELKDISPVLKDPKNVWKLVHTYILNKYNNPKASKYIDRELLNLLDSIISKTTFKVNGKNLQFSNLKNFVDFFDINNRGEEGYVLDENKNAYDYNSIDVDDNMELIENPKPIPDFDKTTLIQNILNIARMIKGRNIDPNDEFTFTELDNPLYNLLSTIGTAINPTGVKVFDILKNEQSKLFSFSNPSDYFMTSDSALDISTALDSLNILESIIYAAQNFKINSGKIIGFNNTLNDIKQFLGDTNLLGSIRDDLGTIMLHDLDLIHSQLVYFYNLALQNANSKLRQHIETESAVEKAILDKTSKITLDYKGQSILPLSTLSGTDTEKVSTLCNTIYDNIDRISKEQKIEKSEIIKEIFKDANTKFSNLLGQETTKFNPQVKAITDYDYYMFLLTSMAIKDIDFSYYLKDVLTNDQTFTFTPFFSQIYAIKMAVGMLVNPNVFDTGLDIINNSVNEHDLVSLDRSVIIDGIGGSGKTSACDALVWRIARKIKPNIQFQGVVPTNEQKFNLAKSLFPNSENTQISNNSITTINKFMETIVDAETLEELKKASNLTPNKYVSFVEKYGTENGLLNEDKRKIKVPLISNEIEDHLLSSNTPGIVFIDEGTFCNTIYANVISKWAKKNNVVIVYTGDTMQNGFSKRNDDINLENIQSGVTLAARTSRLDISMRLVNVQKFYNLNSLTASFPLFSSFHQSGESYRTIAKNIDIKYYSGEEEPLAGEKLSKSFTLEDRQLIEKMVNNGTVGCVWDDKNSEIYKFLQELSVTHKNNIKFYTADEVQGTEMDYFIIDRHSNFNNLWSNGSQVKAIQDFYTMMTRSIKGTLVFDNENHYDDRFNWSPNSDKSTNMIPNPQKSYDEYKVSKIKSLESIVDKYTPTTIVSNNEPNTAVIKSAKVPEDKFDTYIDEIETNTEKVEPTDINGIQGYGFYMRLGGQLSPDGKSFVSDNSNTDLNLFYKQGTNLSAGIEALQNVRRQILYGFKDIKVSSDISSSLPIKKLNLNNGKFGIKIISYNPDTDASYGKLNPIDIKEGTLLYTLVYRLSDNGVNYDITLGSLGLPETWEGYINKLASSDKTPQTKIDSLKGELNDYKKWIKDNKEVNSFTELPSNNITFSKYTVKAKTDVSYNLDDFEARNPGMKCSPVYIQAEGKYAGKPFIFVWPNLLNTNIDIDNVASKYEEQRNSSNVPELIKILPISVSAYAPTAYLDYREGFGEKTFDTILNQINSGIPKASFTKGNTVVNAQILTAMWNWRVQLLKLFETVGISIDKDGEFIFNNSDIVAITAFQQGVNTNEVLDKFKVNDTVKKENIDKVNSEKSIDNINATLKTTNSIFQLFRTPSKNVNTAPGLGLISGKIGITIQKAQQQFDIIDYMLGIITNNLNPYLKESLLENSTRELPDLLGIKVPVNTTIDNKIIKSNIESVVKDEDDAPFKENNSVDSAIAIISALYRHTTSFLNDNKISSRSKTTTITLKDGQSEKSITINTEKLSSFISLWNSRNLNNEKNTYKSTIANMFAMMLNGRLYSNQYGSHGFSLSNNENNTECWNDAPFKNGIYFNPKFAGTTIEKHSSYLAVNSLNQFWTSTAVESPKFYIKGLGQSVINTVIPSTIKNSTLNTVSNIEKDIDIKNEVSKLNIIKSIQKQYENTIGNEVINAFTKWCEENNVSSMFETHKNVIIDLLNTTLEANNINDRILTTTTTGKLSTLSKSFKKNLELGEVITKIENTENGYRITTDKNNIWKFVKGENDKWTIEKEIPQFESSIDIIDTIKINLSPKDLDELKAAGLSFVYINGELSIKTLRKDLFNIWNSWLDLTEGDLNMKISDMFDKILLCK